jgi:hypothetical protein
MATPPPAYDREFTAVYESAEKIGASYRQDIPISFTALLLAILDGDGPSCRWFQDFAKNTGLDRQAMIEYLQKNATTARTAQVTSSAREILANAEEFQTATGAAVLGVRHLLASYIFRLPENHREQMTRWKFDPQRAADSFADHIVLEFPAEAPRWDKYINSPPAGRGGPQPLARFTREGYRESRAFSQIISQTLPDTPYSPNASEVLRLATALAQRRAASSKEPDGTEVSASALFFALLEFGDRKNNLSVNVVLEAVRALPNGEQNLVRETASWYGSTDLLRQVGPADRFGTCTTNTQSLLAEAARLARETSSSEIHVRHLLAALLNVGSTLQSSLLPARLRIFSLHDGRVLGRLVAFLQTHIPSPENMRWPSLFPQNISTRPPIPDYLPDTDSGTDFLNVTDDVEAFATVISSSDLQPPLSIGLFGDWGSGKSFFMRKLRERVDQIADAARASNSQVFHSHIVQIPFNAWHYVDNNLLATLVSDIFEKLYQHFDDKSKTADAQKARDTIQKELENAEGLFQKACATEDKARNDLEIAKHHLDELLKQKSTLSLEQWRQVLADPAVSSELNKLRSAIGDTGLPNSYNQVVADVQQVRAMQQRISSLWDGLWRQPGRGRRFAFLFAFAAVFTAIALLLKYRAGWSAPMSQLVAFAGMITSSVAGRLTELSRLVTKAENALRSVEGAQQRSNNAALQALNEQEAAARQQVGEAEKKVIELRAALQELQPGEVMKKYIRERAAASDYRQHLGVVSLIRKDFEKLSELLDTRDDLPVQRIVLYIDDLDRCPPQRVIEVLEAIHLLLAFKIFVVVVGVDARWISHSLVQKYRGLLHSEFDDVRRPGRQKPNGTATPHDYLEKIFQIPFWIRPLTKDSSQALVGGLARKVASPRPAAVPPSSAPPPPSNTNRPTTPGSEAPQTSGTSSPPPPPPSAQPKVEAKPAPDPEKLKLEDCEIEFMTAMAAYIGRSPRRVKRFVNIYRLIKAGLPADRVPAFLGPASDGEFRTALTLLALLTGAPTVAPALLREMRVGTAADANALLACLAHSAVNDSEIECARGALLHYQHSGWNKDELLQWQDSLGRFSFRPQLP